MDRKKGMEGVYYRYISYLESIAITLQTFLFFIVKVSVKLLSSFYFWRLSLIAETQ